MAPQLGELLDLTTARLSSFSEIPRLDAQVVLAHVLGTTRSWLLAHTESLANAAHTDQLEALVQHLETGIPLPYALGHQEFYGLDLDLTTDVLIPRPETEFLVESAVAWLEASPTRRKVADIGTGSGCIAVSIAAHIPDVRLLATDISRAALKVARGNAHKFGLAHRIDFVECDILPSQLAGLSTDQHFDLLCANLPYIPTGDLQGLAVFGREPTLALDGGPDGLDPFRKLLEVAPDWMAPDGMMLLEIESSRGPAALSLACDALHAADIHLHADLAGRDRLLEIQLSAD